MSAGVAAARAHSNIAFAKYWGKRDGAGNYPAVPSLSVTLEGLETLTRVAFRRDLASDRLNLDGEDADGIPLARVSILLDRVRAASGVALRAEVVSRNDFPTASGLASSASGFAALSLAAARAAGLEWDTQRISDLARRSSASAARSLFGGWVELAGGPEITHGTEVLAAQPVAPALHAPWRVLVAVAGEAKKAIGSTDGMLKTARESPYYGAWLELAPPLHEALKSALLARDLQRFGELAEESALAMHASAIAAGVIYWSGVTIDLVAAVRQLRARGTLAFATMDAGPHVKVLVHESDAALAGTWLRAVPGVLRVLDARPGPGARSMSPEELS